jgi:hypothetical protein
VARVIRLFSCAIAGLKVLAEYKAGVMLKDMPKAPAGRPKKIGSPGEPISPPTFAEQGISKKEALRVQLIADSVASEDELKETIQELEKKPNAMISSWQKETCQRSELNSIVLDRCSRIGIAGVRRIGRGQSVFHPRRCLFKFGSHACGHFATNKRMAIFWLFN